MVILLKNYQNHSLRLNIAPFVEKSRNEFIKLNQ